MTGRAAFLTAAFLTAAAIALPALTLPAYAAGAEAMQAGAYELSRTVVDPRATPPSHTERDTFCLKPEDAKDPEAFVLRAEMNGCKLARRESGRNIVVVELACTIDGVAATKHIDFTIMPTTITGTLVTIFDANGPSHTVTRNVSARRVGDCK